MSNFVALVGAQFGDEGKGKVIDYISADFDYVVRYHGGDNAGHTININGVTHVLKLIPSGIFQTKAIIASGTVINPVNLLKEMEALSQILDLKGKLFISKHAHVIFDFHIEQDMMFEKIRGTSAIGCTNRGIGPCYSDKNSRMGLRIGDLLDYEGLKAKLELILATKNPLFAKYGCKVFDVTEVANTYHALAKKFEAYMVDYFQFFHGEVAKNKSFLLEGSQGILLDLDCGTYPFVTSSNIIGALAHGANVAPNKLNRIIGIVKAYSTRVGNGILVTEIDDEVLAEKIRIAGNEYGSVTKRPRRIGWLDLMSVKYSVFLSGMTEIALTLVDVLNNVDEVKVCIGYKDQNGKDLDLHLPADKTNIVPVYKTFKSWKDDYENIGSFEDFSSELKEFVLFLESFLGVPARIISFGKARSCTVIR